MNDNNENPQNQKPNNGVSEQGNLSKQDLNFNTPPKKSPWGDIFLGLGLSLLLIIVMVASLYIGKAGIISIIMLILISCSTFLSVRLIRKAHPIAGKILLATVIPLTLVLLLFGACFVSLGVNL
jgi:hypothetical protein